MPYKSLVNIVRLSRHFHIHFILKSYIYLHIDPPALIRPRSAGKNILLYTCGGTSMPVIFCIGIVPVLTFGSKYDNGNLCYCRM